MLLEDMTKKANEGHLLTGEFFQNLPAKKSSLYLPPHNPRSSGPYFCPGEQEGRVNQWLGLGSIGRQPGGGGKATPLADGPADPLQRLS